MSVAGGVVLTQISAAAYACGLCIQRYALQEGEDAEPTDPPTSRPDDDGATTLYVRHVSSDYTTSPSTSRYGALASRARRHSKCVWFLGLCVYGLANCVYTVSLDMATLSVLSALFSTVLLWNAGFAWWFLKESLRGWVFGGPLIMAGIILDAIFLPASKTEYGASQLAKLAERPAGVAYVCTVSITLVSLSLLVLYFRCTDFKRETSAIFPVIDLAAHATILGLCESCVQMALKGGSSMFDEVVSGKAPIGKELEKPEFIAAAVVFVVSTLAVVFWLRVTYKRFEVVQVFPLQLSVVEVWSMLGGLLFFNEAHDSKLTNLVPVSLGVLLQLCGVCVLLISRVSELRTGARVYPHGVSAPIHQLCACRHEKCRAEEEQTAGHAVYR